MQSRHIVILKKNLISEKKAPNGCYTLVISLVLTLFFGQQRFTVFFLFSSQRSQNFCLAPPVTRRQHPSSPRDSASPRMPSKSAECLDKNQRIHKGITKNILSCFIPNKHMYHDVCKTSAGWHTIWLPKFIGLAHHRWLWSGWPHSTSSRSCRLHPVTQEQSLMIKNIYDPKMMSLPIPKRTRKVT